MGWSPESRSMILSRVAPREQILDWNTPCWSGPRWISVAVAFRIRSESAARCLWVKPTMPHKRLHLYRFSEITGKVPHLCSPNWVTHRSRVSNQGRALVATSPSADNYKSNPHTNQKHSRPPLRRDLLPEKQSAS